MHKTSKNTTGIFTTKVGEGKWGQQLGYLAPAVWFWEMRKIVTVIFGCIYRIKQCTVSINDVGWHAYHMMYEVLYHKYIYDEVNLIHQYTNDSVNIKSTSKPCKWLVSCKHQKKCKQCKWLVRIKWDLSINDL